MFRPLRRDRPMPTSLGRSVVSNRSSIQTGWRTNHILQPAGREESTPRSSKRQLVPLHHERSPAKRHLSAINSQSTPARNRSHKPRAHLERRLRPAPPIQRHTAQHPEHDVARAPGLPAATSHADRRAHAGPGVGEQRVRRSGEWAFRGGTRRAAGDDGRAAFRTRPYVGGNLLGRPYAASDPASCFVSAFGMVAWES
jgi:hypothetical protein